tara:strand:- start:1561 stop:5427 length:3867 start_codon:yes stop_codon:yes gene_type:complete
MLEELEIKISSQPDFVDGEVVETKSASSITNSELIPIIEKSPAKIVRAQAAIDPNSYQNTVENTSKSSTEAKTSEDAGFSSNRAEPIAVLSQRTVDFQGKPYSTVYASIYQAFMEDQISRVYAKSLFEKILENDATFFDQKNEQIEANILRAKSNIDLADVILAEIRKFDDIMSLKSGKDSIAQIALQKIENIGPLTPFTPLSAIVDPVQLVTGMFVKSNASSIISSKSATTVLMMCLRIVENFLKNGMTTNLVEPGPNQQFLNANPFALGKPLFPTPTVPSIKTLGKDLADLGSVFENGSMILTNSRLAYYGDRNFFYQINKEDPYRRSMIMTTMVANELLVSAGLGRLSQTPLGQRFGSDSLDFPMTYTGASAASATTETSYENSLTDFLLVSQEGSARIETSPGSKKVLLFDGMNFDKSDHSAGTVTTSTSEFAKTTIRTPTNNKMGFFDSALMSAQKSCDDALEFYKMLTFRDADPQIITPHGLYAKILKIVNVGIQAASGDVTYADKNKIAELAILSTIGRTKIKKSRWTRPQVARTIMFSMCAKIAYKLLQKRDELIVHPGTDSISWTDSTGKKKTKVSIQKEGSSSKDTFTIETEDVTKNTEDESIGLDTSAIRMAAKEKNIFDVEPMTGNARMLVYGMSSLSKTDNIENPEIFDMNLLSLVDEIAENEDSMMYQLASLFVDATIEAASLAQSENKEANFINSNRVTRLSKIDGSSLLCLLFESVVDLCSVLSTTTLMYKILGPTNSEVLMSDTQVSANFTKALKNEFWPKASAIIGAEHVVIRVRGQFGEGSSNHFTSRALELLIEGLETGTFQNAFNDEGLIPNLDLESPSVDISGKVFSGSSQSFSSFVELLEELAAERDLPYLALASYAAKFDYVRQQTQSLIDLSSKLAGTSESDEVSDAFSSFASTDIGKNYLLSLTDASLAASKKRLKEIVRAKNSPAKRNPKITVGELAAIKVLCEELSATPSESVNIFFVGLPTEYLDNTIYPQFKIAEGFLSPIAESTMSANVSRVDSITGEKSTGISFLFSTSPTVSSKSFDSFATKPPNNIDAVVNEVLLENGQLGLTFINSAASKVDARNLVKNEVKSHLIKKIISILSPNDFFVESLTDFKKSLRDTGSEILANNLGIAAGLEDGTFSGVFIQTDNSSFLNYDKMLKLTAVETTKMSNKHVSNMKKLNFGKAEIFYDIFSSTLFTAGSIERQIFSPTYFDRIVAVICDNSMFSTFGDSSTTEIVSGKPTTSDNQYASDLAKSDVTQGTFGIYNYEVLVTSGQSMVKK